MAVYTYKDFEDYAKQNGILDRISDYDLTLARTNPDAGMEIARAAVDYGTAESAEAKALAHTKAEQVRKSYGGYTGGGDGSSPSFTASNYDTGEYADPYKLEKQKALSEVVNFDDNYSPDTDPLAQSYRRAALRSAKEAEKGTLSAIAGANGGQVSTSAAAATAQASAEARAKIADKFPELYEAAYNRALNNYSAARSASADSQNAFSTAIANKWSVVNNKLSEAAAKAAVGDYSGYAALGIDTSKYQSYEQLQRDIETATVAAQYGDTSKLAALGFDMSRALKEQQLSDAEAAAQYGDTSKLREMGVDTSLYDAQQQAALAASRASTSNTLASAAYSNARAKAKQTTVWDDYYTDPTSLSGSQLTALESDATERYDNGTASLNQIYYLLTRGKTVDVDSAQAIAEDYGLDVDLSPTKTSRKYNSKTGKIERVGGSITDAEATARLLKAMQGVVSVGTGGTTGTDEEEE